MAAYTSRASATVVSPSVAATAVRSAASLEEDIRAARASGASSNTRPRFVLDGTQRAVASTAARSVAPRGGAPAAASAGPIATALARKSSYVASWKRASGDTLPGLGALASSRQASCAAAATSAARAACSRRRQAPEQMLDDRRRD